MGGGGGGGGPTALNLAFQLAAATAGSLYQELSQGEEQKPKAASKPAQHHLNDPHGICQRSLSSSS